MATGADLRDRWRAGETTFGLWNSIPSPLPVELGAMAGFDWVCVDLQHGLVGLEAAGPMLQAASLAGAVPLARVPANEPWLAMRALDLGASGVFVPLVESAAEAERAAMACRFPPSGARSFGPIRATSPADPDPARMNHEVLCLVMVETRRGVEELEQICAVPGVDGVYIGPADLGLTHGLGRGPELDALIGRIVETCQASGMPVGIQAGSGAAARAYAELGVSFAAACSDRDLVAQAARRELAQARGVEPEALPLPGEGPVRAVARFTERAG